MQEEKVKLLRIKNGYEDQWDAIIPIRKGMEVDLLATLEDMKEIEIEYEEMPFEKHREIEIKSIMYAECCEREEAIKILDAEENEK
jgi:hypothetical protein